MEAKLVAALSLLLAVGQCNGEQNPHTGITTAMTARLLATLSLLLVARQLTGESKSHTHLKQTHNVCCLNY